MLSIFKKIFGKTEPKAAAPVAAKAAVPAPPSTPMPTIEVAHLSLAAIVARFPDELKSLLQSEPDASATVALPMPTILKQLPTGSVKMSLASLHRQAHGLIAPLPPGDKRSVDVPLAEVFRHLKPNTLRRRADQRRADVPDSGFNLFSDSSNPYAIAPDAEAAYAPEPQTFDIDEAPEELPPVPAPAPSDAPRVLKMDDSLRSQLNHGNGAATQPKEDARDSMPRAISPPPAFKAPASTSVPARPAATPPRSGVQPPAAAPAAPAPAPSGATLDVALSSLAGAWPEAVQAEISGLDPSTTVALPVAEVSAGLAKGRVSFAWKQIHAWLTPAAGPSAVAGDTALQLPLKVIAPIFMSANKPTTERKTFQLDESIPALFADARPPEEKLPPPAPEPEPVAPELLPAPVMEAAPVAEPVAPSVEAVEAPVVEAAPVEAPAPAAEQIAPPVAEPIAAPVVEPVHQEVAAPALAPAAETEPIPAPVIAAPATAPAPEPEVAPAQKKLADTVGEIFGNPNKQNWTPTELVAGTVKLSGVAGAIVALQEGLPVAASLPEGVKSDVVAAFLPQIFARLNQYAGEMKLGDVDDLLFTTHGAHCQIYRLGYIYFAVLGKAGEALPWHELHLITEELARHTHK